MRRVFDEQTYLNFSGETSLKVVKEYRAKYAWIDECLQATPLILWLVHEDLETLSKSNTDYFWAFRKYRGQRTAQL